MKRFFKQTISVILVVFMVFGSAPLNGFVGLELPNWLDFSKLFEVEAEAATYSGTCGSNLTWTFDESAGVLQISGTGAMNNYSYSSSKRAPWYSYRLYIKTVKIGNGVTSIGDRAFYSCTSLTSITIPDSITSIGDGAFDFCISLTSITIPDSVTSIGNSAFDDCDSLTSITIPDSVTSIGEYAFYYCDRLTSITIPDSVTSIGEGAFANCISLTSITIPESVTSIGRSMFYSCDSLTSITIGNSVTSIGNDVFAHCTSLTSITIPDSVTRIGYAFYNCDSLTSITVDKNNKNYSNDDFGVLFNKNKTVLRQYPIGNARTTYTIPDSVTSIGDSAFRDCDSLTSITIGNSVTSIGNSAFEDCDSLTSITIGNSVTSIGGSAFEDCDSLTSISIGNSVTSIGGSAFYDCDSLTSITIGNSVTSIGGSAFYDCDSLTSITVDKNNKNYSNDDFGVLFNKNKTVLRQYPIGNARTTYTIPDSVTSIGDSAFRDCDSLTSITIGNSVKSIGLFAFYDCDSLADVYYSGTESQWNAISIGSDNRNLTNATIHYNCTSEPVTKYITGSIDNIVKSDYSYTDEFFSRSSDCYYHDFAKMSLILASSAMVKDLKDETEEAYDGREPSAAKKLLGEIGFGDDADEDLVCYGYDDMPKTNTIACVIASKNISDTETVIAVAVRGGGYEWEWGGNFNIGTSVNHEGFIIAKTKVLSQIEEFVKNNKSSLNGKEVKFWITGYSRSAATANLVAATLDDKSLNKLSGYPNVNSLDFSKEDIFAYCFETPRNTKDTAVKNARYNNIFNIINPIDPVPKVAPAEWGYNRYGVDCYLPSAETHGKGYGELRDSMAEHFYEISGDDKTYDEKFVFYQIKPAKIIAELLIDYYLPGNVIDTELFTPNKSMGQGAFLDGLIDIVADDVIGSPENYVENYQDAMTLLFPVFYLGKLKGFELGSVDDEAVLDYALTNAWKMMVPFKLVEYVEGLKRVAALSLLINSVSVFHPDHPEGLKYDDVMDVLGELDDVALGMLVHPNYLYTLINALFNKEDYSKLFLPHETETTLAWMKAIESTDLNPQLTQTSTYRVVKFNCPVNINVYDSEGVLKASIIDDEVQYIEGGYISTYINENGEKCFCLPNDEEYSFEITGTDEGTMSCSVSDFDFETRENIASTNYYEIPVSKDEQINGILEIKVEEEKSTVTLTDEKETVIEQSETIINSEAEVYTVTATTESEASAVLGGGEFVKGEFAKVTAIAGNEETFDGWYADGELVSTELEYKFMVEADCSLVAKFVSWPSVTWVVDGNKVTELVNIGDVIAVPAAPEKEGYTFVGWDRDIPDTMPAEDLTFTAVWSKNSYKVTWIVDGAETETSVAYGEEITAPVPKKEGYSFVGWDKEIPDTMPAEELEFTAVFELSLTASIRTPSTTTIKYGDGIVLHADTNEALPSGWKIKWSASNGNFDYTVSADGTTCTISPKKSGDTTFTVTVLDADGNEICKDTQAMTSKAGFFDKLIAFFKSLFGLTKVYPEAFNG